MRERRLGLINDLHQPEHFCFGCGKGKAQRREYGLHLCSSCNLVYQTGESGTHVYVRSPGDAEAKFALILPVEQSLIRNLWARAVCLF